MSQPKQYKQTSRKSKKSWIKNIDLEDLEAKIDENNTNLIKFGVPKLDELSNDNLFIVDTNGEENESSKAYKTKITKSLQILNKTSKVPKLENHHIKKKSSVSKKQAKTLMKLAGRDRLAQSSTKVIHDKDGLIKNDTNDLWGDDEKEQQQQQELKGKSDKEWTKPTRKPNTLAKSSIELKKIEKIPNSGKSYNPSLESWKNLISSEYLNEKAKEDLRVKLEQERLKIENLIETLHDSSEDESSDEEEDEDEEQDSQDDIKLSLNKPTVLKKKTKTQRNKQKNHKLRTELQSELKQLKSQMKELNNISKLEKEVTAKQINKNPDTNAKIAKRSKLGSKYKVEENPTLELKLSNELNDSLRLLKPEGDLILETMNNFYKSGKLEKRVKVVKKRKYTPKITEKWTYKDFK